MKNIDLYASAHGAVLGFLCIFASIFPNFAVPFVLLAFGIGVSFGMYLEE